MKKAIRIFDVILSFICAIIFAVVAWGNAYLPGTVVCYDNDSNRLAGVFSLADGDATLAVDVQSSSPRKSTLKLFGEIHVKEVMVSQSDAKKVMVSGEAFGIKLYTDGVIVVGVQDVQTDSGKRNPAKECGIEVGDVIVSIDNINVYTSDDVQSILCDNNGTSFDVKIKRGERYKSFTLTPVYCEREGCYKAGMWVRDSTAGIGTITFYNQNSGIFAALGHQINDVDTKEIMPILDGEAGCSTVKKLEKSTRGNTGSRECDFQSQTIGRLLNNTDCGIYGAFAQIPDCAREYPVASVQEVKRGAATVICTVDSGKPQEYDIEIVRISYNESNREKNMIVRITDNELIEKTGGIVQGMSGSPIIQNGKLIGALTHVIVGNPQKGYAVFAQTMVEQSENN